MMAGKLGWFQAGLSLPRPLGSHEGRLRYQHAEEKRQLETHLHEQSGRRL